MIKENELRIGNHVAIRVDSDGTFMPYTVIGILGDGRIYSDWVKDIAINEGDFEGILLTSEILEAAGFSTFKDCDHGIQSTLNGFDFKKHEGENISIVLVNWSYTECDEIGTYIDYVHQLQNLYFALTGEELEIKL